MRALQIVGDRHQRLKLGVVEQCSVRERGQVVEIGTNAVLPFEQAARCDFQRGIARKEIGRFVPLPLVDIIAIGRLQPDHRTFGAEQGDFLGKFFECTHVKSFNPIFIPASAARLASRRMRSISARPSGMGSLGSAAMVVR